MANSGSLEKDYVNNCISSLEHHVHNIFASARVPGEDFVYSPSIELFNKLDDFCDHQPANRQESKPPFLIKGESGTGKSALLSNWIHRRERNSTRSKTNSPLGEEFLFWHAVGCSRQSMNANFLIRRLISDLKNRFELARDVPKSQERLSWELPRFLELAAKKGRVIIVIDGLNRLVNNDNGEDGLTWLPLQFPPNVRFILSVTTPPGSAIDSSSSDSKQSVKGTKSNLPAAEKQSQSSLRNADSSTENDKHNAPAQIVHKAKKSRILQELERRNVPFIILKPLERNLCRSVVETFSAKSVSNEHAALATGPYVSHYIDLESHDGTELNATDSIPGFLLFESQINSLLSHSEGGTPLFLRMFLRCLQFAVSRGFSLWFVFERWIQAKNIPDLLESILKTFEEGSVATRESCQMACDKTVLAGGLPALKATYSWHPFFQALKSSEAIVSKGGLPAGGNSSEKGQGTRASVTVDRGHAADSFNAEMATHIAEGALSDSNWSVPPGASKEEKNKAGSGNSANTPSSGGGGKNVSQLVRQSLADQQMNEVSQQADLKLQLALKQSLEIIDDAIQLVREKVDSPGSPTFMRELVGIMKEAQLENSKPLGRDQNGFSLRATVITPKNSEKNLFSGPKETSLSEIPEMSKSVDSIDIGVETPFAGESVHSNGSLSHSSSEVEREVTFDAKIEEDLSDIEFPVDSTPATTRNVSLKDSGRRKSILRQSFQPQVAAVTVVDPSEGLHLLPVSLRGGVTTVGFEDLLGNALALLYVARHGLREKELWKILSQLQFRAEISKRADLTASKEVRMQQLELTRQLANQVLNSRGLLEDIFKAEDITHSGYINVACITAGLKKLFPDTSKSDVLKLLEFIESNMKGSEAQPLQQGGKVNYERLVQNLIKLNRQSKFSDSSSSKNNIRKSTKGLSVDEEDEDDDNYNNFDLHFSPNFKKKMLQKGSTKSLDGESRNSFNEEQKSELDEKNYTLGPVIEESLLGILSALGVLHSAENKLLILPSDSEPFRKIIYDRYILKRGGCTPEYWHQQIIQYFQTEANSLRRCEELPWHLKICRKWNLLRDTLVDLKTFDLMYNNDLKDELMEYWLLLTEGPLFAHAPVPENPANASAHGYLQTGKSYDDDDNDSENNILRDIDRAMEVNSSLKEIRKNSMQQQVQPFDVVEELNKSVEQWVVSTKPQPVLIHKVVTQISRFLAEFSKLAKSSPRFLRIGIDLHSMELFGITFDEIKADIAVNHSSLGVSGDTNEERDKEKPSESKLHEAVFKEGPAQFPTEAMLSSGKNLYPYLRWVWMQFPWIALHRAASLAHNDENGNVSTDPLTLGGEIGDDGLPLHPAVQNYQGPTTNEIERLHRVWNCKKTDPTNQVFQKSNSRLIASLKPRGMAASASLEKSVEIALDILYDEIETEAEEGAAIVINAPLTSDKSSKKIAPDNPTRPRARSNSKLSGGRDEGSLVDSLRSKRSGSKGKAPRFDIEAALASYNESANAQHNNTFLTEVDEEIKHMGADDFIFQQEMKQLELEEMQAQQKRNSKETQAALYSHMLDRIAKMKSIWNKLDIIHRDRLKALADCESQVSIRRESDAQLISDVNNGEALIKALGERNIAIERSLTDVKTINEGYSQLLKALKKNAPFRESHVKSLEIELELAERQFKDLCQHRSNLYKDAERLETIRKKEINDRISYFASARAEIALKKSQVEVETKNLKREAKNEKLLPKSAFHSLPPSALDTKQRRRSGGSSVYTSNAGSKHSSDSESQALNISKPLAAFLNALTRKKTYNTNLIKEGDTLQSIRKHDIFKKASDQKEQDMTTITVGASGHGGDGSLIEKAKKAGNSAMIVIQDTDYRGNDSNLTFGSIHSFGGQRSENGKARIEEVERLRSSISISSNQSPSRGQARNQVQKLIKYLLQKTESSSVDNFLERFQQNKKLVDVLNNQQMLLDSRLSQLRTEHHELSTLHSDMSFVGDEPLRTLEVTAEDNDKAAATAQVDDFEIQNVRIKPSPKTHASGASTASSIDDGSSVESLNQSLAEDENDDRYIDSKLFSKEVRLRQLQLQNKNSVNLINEARTAVAHVMNIIKLNEKLLTSLPKIPPPALKDDSDIILCLLWCEDRIIAVNEALSMETNKPSSNTADDMKSLSQRQNELATLIMQSAAKDPQKRQSEALRSQTAEKKKRKQHGAMSRTVINNSDSNLPTPSAVMVTSHAKVDHVYDAKVAKLCAERDKRQDLIESKRMYAEGSESNNDLQKFLAGGIDIKATKDLTRKSGLLTNKRRGRQINYGLVLQDLIESKGQTVSLLEKNKGVATTSPQGSKPKAAAVKVNNASIVTATTATDSNILNASPGN